MPDRHPVHSSLAIARIAPPRDAGLLALIVGLGLALRLARLDAASLWTDELFSVAWSAQPLGFLWGGGMAVESNPPLYYTLLHAWMACFGDGDAVARLPGALLSAATIGVVFTMLRDLAGRRAGLLAALLFALSPAQIGFAQEARAYALLPLLMGLATLGLLGFIRTGGRGPLALHAAAGALLAYTHATGPVAFAALTLGGLAACPPATLRRRAGPWLAALAGVVALAAPAARASLALSGSANIAWIPTPNPHLFAEVLAVLFVDPATPQAAFVPAALLGGLVPLALLAALARRPPAREAWAFLAVPALAFLLLMTAISLRVPVLIPRVALWLGVPVAGLAALALRERGNRLLLGLPLAVATLVGLHGVWFVTPQVKEDWRGLMADLSPRLAPGDTVALGVDSVPFGVARYGGPRPLLRWEPAPPRPDALLFAADRLLPIRPVDTPALAERAAAGHLWLILGNLDLERHGAAARALLPPPRIALEGRPGLRAWGW